MTIGDDEGLDGYVDVAVERGNELEDPEQSGPEEQACNGAEDGDERGLAEDHGGDLRDWRSR